jgi:hypothetical protein
MKAKNNPDAGAASASITDFIEALGDWRGTTLAHLRKLIREADPNIVEEWKWVRPKSPGTPVWSHDGIVCVGGAFKEWVKLTFFRGASLNDPKKLFNSGLKGGTWRAIDIREGDTINEAAFKQLIRAAVVENRGVSAERALKAAAKKAKK